VWRRSQQPRRSLLRLRVLDLFTEVNSSEGVVLNLDAATAGRWSIWAPFRHLFARTKGPVTIFDGWRSISLALYMTLVGYGVLVGIPVISTAWVELLGFTEVQVGRVAGADLGGLALGATLAALVMARVNRRLLMVIGAALAILANGLCIIFLQYEQVLLLRIVSGVGSGIYTAVAVATLGATTDTARAYNLMLFAFAFSQALEIWFLPRLPMSGIYMVFIVAFALSLFFMRWLPARGLPAPLESESERNESGLKVPRYVVWLCLGAILVTYINIGSYWTYIELASLDAGVSDGWIGGVLFWASFLSIVGCLFATLVSNRFGLARPLLGALFVMAVIVGMLASGINDINILLSVFMFNFLWIFIDVYQMATVANFDRAGSFASLMPAVQGLGQIIGPNLAATILGLGLGYSGVFVMCAIAALCGLSIYALMYVLIRTRTPALLAQRGL